MDTSCTWQTSIPFIGLGLPELLLYDFCYLVTFLSVVWNRGWDNCVDFVLQILTDKSVLLLLGELLGIQTHCHCIGDIQLVTVTRLCIAYRQNIFGLYEWQVAYRQNISGLYEWQVAGFHFLCVRGLNKLSTPF